MRGDVDPPPIHNPPRGSVLDPPPNHNPARGDVVDALHIHNLNSASTINTHAYAKVPVIYP